MPRLVFNPVWRTIARAKVAMGVGATLSDYRCAALHQLLASQFTQTHLAEALLTSVIN